VAVGEHVAGEVHDGILSAQEEKTTLEREERWP
jgi:hypothetical protein